MFKIMFVCHGNICRSPMAEFIFKDIVKKNGVQDRFYVSSAATSTEEIWNGIGSPIYPPAKEMLLKHGISCGDKNAVLLQKTDYEKYDLFVVMDSKNYRNTIRIFGADPYNKVKKLLAFCNKEDDVADPWYSGDFTKAYNDIYEGCTALFEILIK